MKKLLIGALMMAASVIGVSTAQATTVSLTPGASFSGTISGQATCPTCSAEITFALNAAGTQLTITLENTSTDGVDGINIITGLGFNTDPTLDPTNTTHTLSGGMSTWEVVGNGGGLGNMDIIVHSGNGVNDGLDGGDSGTAVFTFSAVSSLTIDPATIHVQALLNGKSVKLDCCVEGEGATEGEGSGEGEGGVGEGEGGGGGEGAVPEPASLLLLGIGLSGAAARMVRKNRA